MSPLASVEWRDVVQGVPLFRRAMPSQLLQVADALSATLPDVAAALELEAKERAAKLPPNNWVCLTCGENWEPRAGTTCPICGPMARSTTVPASSLKDFVTVFRCPEGHMQVISSTKPLGDLQPQCSQGVTRKSDDPDEVPSHGTCGRPMEKHRSFEAPSQAPTPETLSEPYMPVPPDTEPLSATDRIAMESIEKALRETFAAFSDSLLAQVAESLVRNASRLLKIK